jgi:AcrR family transcriptional regulator
MTSTSDTVRRPARKTAKAADDPRTVRAKALADVRRELVLDAARAAFVELGMEKTSIREVAQRAGYTPGAIYSYFSSKEEMYGALLAESLDRLNQQVAQAVASSEEGEPRLRAAANAFFQFYLANPRDLDLGFYLFQGMKPRGLTPELNEELNACLLQSLRPSQAELERLGMPAKTALQELTSLFAHTVGLLVMSHTGRIRMFKQGSAELFETYLGQLVERATGARKS